MITYDAWLTRFLQRKAYHLNPGEFIADIFSERLNNIHQKNSSYFIDTKVNIVDETMLYALEKCGFLWRDVHVHFTGAPDSLLASCAVRNATTSDQLQLHQIATEAFKLSRFHRDPLLGNDIGDTIKMETINSFFAKQRGDGLLVYDEGNTIAGFVLYFIRDKTLFIDNIAISSCFRGRGFGKQLLYSALADTRADRLSVTTQLINIEAQNFYSSLYLKPISYSAVLHLHGNIK